MALGRTYHWFVGVLLKLHKSYARNMLKFTVFDAVGVVAIQKWSKRRWGDTKSFLAINFSCNDIVCVQKCLQNRQRTREIFWIIQSFVRSA